eukprot:TRINITY_DN30663_c0_g1_i1.p1 TRINITY_DN30663_c0_g1~~TRINITY_DN30663_c0_g1_i1.p1  ORF type:complete len:121 (+),score=28.13 TRINITY_DN30663_c0_g1_i1:264-626(+)
MIGLLDKESHTFPDGQIQKEILKNLHHQLETIKTNPTKPLVFPEELQISIPHQSQPSPTLQSLFSENFQAPSVKHHQLVTIKQENQQVLSLPLQIEADKQSTNIQIKSESKKMCLSNLIS